VVGAWDAYIQNRLLDHQDPFEKMESRMFVGGKFFSQDSGVPRAWRNSSFWKWLLSFNRIVL
jgi:hypothetical protein